MVWEVSRAPGFQVQAGRSPMRRAQWLAADCPTNLEEGPNARLLRILLLKVCEGRVRKRTSEARTATE